MSLKYLFSVALWAAVALFAVGYVGWIPLTGETLGIAGGALVLLTLAAACFAELVDRRLSTMTRAAEQLAAGMERVRLETPKGDEITSLTYAFNNMAEKMQHRVTDLENSLQSQRTLVEHAPDAMWVFHVEEFRLVDVNENFLKLLEQPREQVVGFTPMDHSPPLQANGVETKTYAQDLIGRVLQGERVVAPWTIRTRLGAEIPCELRAIRMPASDRTLICGSLMDVRDRLRTQSELAYRLRFEGLVNRLSSVMIGLPLEQFDDGVRQALADIGLFAQVDRSYVFQFDESQTLVSCTHEWCAPGIAPQIQRLQNLRVADYPWVEAQLRQGQVVHVPRLSELPQEARTERQEWETESIRSILLVPTQAGGVVTGYVGFDSVHTEKSWPQDTMDLLKIFGEIVLNTRVRTHAEAALRQKNEALAQTVKKFERSNEELKQFAYVASHDLQEPLRSISSFSALLERRYHDQLDDKGRDYLNYLRDAAKRMHALINGLLDYSRIDSGALDFGNCDMSKIMTEALANLDAALRDSGARVTHDPLPVIAGEPSQLMQVVQNLIGNALKFRGTDAPRVHVGVRRADGADSGWEFSVRDNGIGIAPSDASQLFQLFKRLHAADHYPGTGIGLAVCKRIVERHHGRIWVKANTPEPGSTFCFTLPVGTNIPDVSRADSAASG